MLVWLHQRLCTGKRPAAFDRSTSRGAEVASRGPALACRRWPLSWRIAGARKTAGTIRSRPFSGVRERRCQALRCTGRVRLSLRIRRLGNSLAGGHGGRTAVDLDAPCGGCASLTVALRERGFAAIGADIDPEAVMHLGAAFQKVNLDGTLPWPNRSFDAVVSTEGIEHFENHYSFLREMHRILKPAGSLLLTTPNITALRSRVRFFGSGFFGRDARLLNEAARHPLHHIGLATFPELRY